MARNQNSVHYVDNIKFTAAVSEYSALCKLANKEGKPEPQMSNYIGSCILKIAQRLSSAPNFASYSYRDEMISDGIENVFLYLRNFDPDKIVALGKKPNAFAYVTQIIYYAFLRRIEKEKKQQYIKQKSIETSGMLSELVTTQDHDNAIYANQFMEMLQSSSSSSYNKEKEDDDLIKSRRKRKPKMVKPKRSN